MQQLHFVQHVRIVHYTFIQYCFCFVWHLTAICYLGFNRNVTSDSVFSFFYLLFIKTNYNSNIKIEKKNKHWLFFAVVGIFGLIHVHSCFFVVFFFTITSSFWLKQWKHLGSENKKQKTKQSNDWDGLAPTRGALDWCWVTPIPARHRSIIGHTLILNTLMLISQFHFKFNVAVWEQAHWRHSWTA